MIARKKNFLMTLTCFFTACHGGHSRYTFGYGQFDNRGGKCIVPLLPGTFDDLDAVGQYDVIRKSGFVCALSMPVLRCALEVE